MPIHLLRISFRTLRYKASEPYAEAGHWNLVARCEGGDEGSCVLFRHIAGMPAASDRKAALAALVKLVQVAASGQPLQTFYDETQCHELHRFHYAGHDRVVWRIRKGDVRVAFFYGQGRVVFLADAIVKRKDRLSHSEKAALEREVITYIDAETAGELVVFESSPNIVTQRGTNS